ncbi:MAG: MetQ/NlpA family ABC transporter substrate-binding protein [Campylobacter sputorum]|uniref:MetQ/NlpA family ABC transporter substrate-binding protein n=1 Tax=Campylobacter sputorum TaxID=206 RepID=UPI000B786493|nr:MetQ/NlpA family ABC transporter substrate-binding protein [Campylobacter sputorum]ASM38628.1 DL-methionine ABC transporter MetINQ, substrate-binding protein [Campylobacter sputorum bv. paraureolyticus LMG 11764]MDY6120854.1 MetQ/NlpA family ABC transporter substrate-binding protein [Campylobacter sputorum]
MKKIVFSLLLSFLVTGFANAAEKIVVGATPVPHAEILEVIKPELAKAGYDLDIKIFNDYVIPNVATDSGELDANFFQHLPYLEEFNKNKGTKLVSTASVHIEPMGVYSKNIKDLNELKKGAKVSIPNDPTNESRALDVLATAGLIELSNATLKTPLDITKNPKNLKFIEIEAASLPRTLDDVDISVINTNYALSVGLNPKKDALALESKDSPYANIVVVSEKNIDSKKTKALNQAIQSEAVKKFIDEKYKGAIIPAF